MRWPQAIAWALPAGGRCPTRAWPGAGDASAESSPDPPPAPPARAVVERRTQEPPAAGRTGGSYPVRADAASAALRPLGRRRGPRRPACPRRRTPRRRRCRSRCRRDRPLEEGRASAGARRRYTGTAGHSENARVGVFPALATSRGRALLDQRRHLPGHSWANDPERRTAAGIPETVRFATEPRPAGEMVTAALDAKITASWVTRGEAYGRAPPSGCRAC
ncbi:transposase [Streptomyces sp. NPDC001777]|uniref:transposase n=1 Tax=Streptomyces sp. NPDC001777 TaxID=3364608 RepID=UPI00367E7F8F